MMKYLIRKRAIGDVLWIEPVIRQLAEQTKELRVFTKYNILFENYPLSNVFFINQLSFLQKVIYQSEIFLHKNLLFYNLEMAYERDPYKHILHAYQAKLGLPVTNEYPRLYISPQEKVRIADERYVVLHLESFAGSNYRNVYGVSWQAIAKYLSDKGYKVIQIGLNPVAIDNVTNFKGTLRQMIGVISNADLFIGLDSGPSNIAASLGIPAVIFFGSVNPLFRHFPELRKLLFIQEDCIYAGCYHTAVSKQGRTCRIVGDKGEPPCCKHDTFDVINKIDDFISDL